jgi:Leucine-rich repeat (LRR) protein
MFFKLAVLAIMATVAESVVTQPRVCKTFIQTADLPPKYLCFVNMDLTAFQASKICKTNGMNLYDPNSSPESLSALIAFGKTTLGGSQKAEVYISGRIGTKCKVFTGNGKTKFIPCATISNFVCEIAIQPVKCEDYTDGYNYEDSRLVDLTGIANPKSCEYFQPITDQTTVLATEPTLMAKENIVVIDMDGTSEIQYLPLKIAENFPNLSVLTAEGCGILSISYENLKGLTKLKYLALDFNQITVLDAAVLQDLGGILRLDYINPVTAISPNIFSVTLPLLNELYMDGLDTSCIDTACYEERNCVAVLLGSVTNTCAAL